ncbi:hypothetical protein E2C01_090431 [Portunus trituberculatus]|uniref:Uncharacterized protein n=1 Tax=Portunus trituberculatus TaxID=210409 RepID=A0A5B7JK82_PORTR|nr:hypothetical protein [Portunus trituberculatus]
MEAGSVQKRDKRLKKGDERREDCVREKEGRRKRYASVLVIATKVSSGRESALLVLECLYVTQHQKVSTALQAAALQVAGTGKQYNGESPRGEGVDSLG